MFDINENIVNDNLRYTKYLDENMKDKNIASVIMGILAILFILQSQNITSNSNKVSERLEALRTEIKIQQKINANVSAAVVDLNRSITQLQREVQSLIEKNSNSVTPTPTVTSIPSTDMSNVPYPKTGSEADFEPLFEAYTQEHPQGWIVQGLEKAGPTILNEGVLKIGGWDYWAVISQKEYGDFVLRFDVKFDSRGNSGVLIHTPKEHIYKNVNRLEIQLEAGDDPKISDLRSKFGAIERIKAPQAFPVKPLGEWNTVEIVYMQHRLWVKINDVIAQEGVDIRQYEELRDHPQWGSIALQRNDIKKPVYFKNIRIKVL